MMKLSTLATCVVSQFGILAITALVAGDEPPLATERPAGVVSDPNLEAILDPILKTHQVPGLVAGVLNRDGLTTAGAVGIRKVGSPEMITVGDKLHLGSNTKAMTATLIARLVEEGKLSWQLRLADGFADFKDELHADFLDVTLEQLLTHRAGLPANGPYREVDGSLVDAREELLKLVLAKPTAYPPGTKFLYSNVGYIAAGHMAERVTGKSWEQLITSELFEPLKMHSAGFGFPGEKGQVDQPWGHGSFFNIPLPQQLDNPPVLGPAGTVHCSLEDWARFVAPHLAGARGEERLLKPDTFKILHSPPAGGDYAMGWGLIERPWAKGPVPVKGPVLWHSGSNTMWFAMVMIAPERDVAFLVATNFGGTAGAQACEATLAALIKFAGLSTDEPK